MLEWWCLCLQTSCHDGEAIKKCQLSQQNSGTSLVKHRFISTKFGLREVCWFVAFYNYTIMAVGSFKLMYGSRVEGVISNDLYLGGQLNFVYIYIYVWLCMYVCIYIYAHTRYTYIYMCCFIVPSMSSVIYRSTGEDPWAQLNHQTFGGYINITKHFMGILWDMILFEWDMTNVIWCNYM